MRKGKNRPLSFRLFLVFFAVLIPLEIAQFAMYKWGTDAVTNELNTAAQSNVVYLRDNLERSILDVYKQTDLLLEQEIINEFFVYGASTDNAQYYMNVRAIMSLLALARNSSPYIDEIRLYYPTRQLVITSAKKISMGLSPSEIMARIASATAQGQMLVELDQKYLIWNTKPSSAGLASDAMPPYYMEIYLDSDSLRAHLSSFSNYSNKNALMVNHATQSVLLSDNFVAEPGALDALLGILSADQNDRVQTGEIRPDAGENMYVSCYSRILNCSFAQIIPSEALMSIPRSFRSFALAFSLLGVLGAFVFSVFLRLRVRAPLDALVRGYEQAGEGDFSVQLPEKVMTTAEFQRLTLCFNDMIRHLKQLVYTNYEKTMRLQRAELKQLQSQINPHFLYNSFFFLRHMVKRDDKEQALKLLTHLGDYFKYIERNAQDAQCLRLEYAHAMDYLNIQLMRFEGRVELRAQALPEALQNVRVPRLILQPVFENIFDHCDMNVKKRLIITLDFERLPQGYFVARVEDNGDQLTDERLREICARLDEADSSDEATALVNIHRRISLMFGEACRLRISRGGLGGLLVEITMHEGAYE